MLASLLTDLRLAARTLVKAPGFTTIAVLCLALGIGANTTVFSSIYGLMLRPMPFHEPERVVVAWTTNAERGVTESSWSYLDWRDLGNANGAFSTTALATERSVNLGGVEEPERLVAARVTSSIFPVLGVQPALGRAFTPDEDLEGNVVVLGDGLWRRRFAGDPGVIGREVTINGRAHVVIGVLPPKMRFPEASELWLPLAPGEAKDQRNWTSWIVHARLAPGVTMEQANERVATVMRGLAERHPDTNKGRSARVSTWRENVLDEVRPVMLVMFGAVLFVLLIACGNVANLLLVRGAGRQRELAVRTALGAGRWRVVRLLLAEGLLLALGGGLLGIVIGAWGVDWIVRALPANLPFWMEFDINREVVAFTFGLSLLTVLVFGLVPALHTAGSDVTETLKDGGRGATAGRRAGRLRSSLVVGEIALSVVLLVGATLMIRSFVKLRTGDPGFANQNLATLELALAGPRFENDTAVVEFYDRLLERVAAVPGVTRVATSSQLPIVSCCNWSPLFPEGTTHTPSTAPMGLYSVVSAGFFETMGIPLVSGRTIAPTDRPGAPRVVVINQALARQVWPNESPIGKTLRFRPPGDTSAIVHTVVGVVGVVKQRRLTEDDRPHSYVPHAQNPWRGMEVVASVTPPAASMLKPIREAVRELDRDLPVSDLQTMDDWFAQRTFDSRIYGSMFGAFGLIALFLASIGLYGVMSYSVSQRTHEIGVRMALGAQQRDVLGLVVGQGSRLAAVGLLLGVPAAFGLARLLRGALYGVTPSDVATFVGVVGVLGGVALLASWLPARRAAHVDPAQALRAD
jgi:putative ABC transport system permease protein